MKWTAISGSWRVFNRQVETDVRSHVADVIRRGDGIVTGGALGVDYIATDEVLTQNPSAGSLKIILPTTLEIYRDHYFMKAGEGVITHSQAQELIAQLECVQKLSSGSLVEMFYLACNQQSYYARNTAVIEAADALLAFQVNGSAGTKDAIDKARARGIPIVHLTYSV